MAELSIVVPVYGCALSLRPLYERIVSALEGVVESWELVLVNDGSTDGGWAVVAELADEDNRVIGVDLSRNFGQHSAINAGLAYSCGPGCIARNSTARSFPPTIYQGRSVATAE
jgi:polyisoprenyl-phosphate glycosyltransferase